MKKKMAWRELVILTVTALCLGGCGLLEWANDHVPAPPTPSQPTATTEPSAQPSPEATMTPAPTMTPTPEPTATPTGRVLPTPDGKAALLEKWRSGFGKKFVRVGARTCATSVGSTMWYYMKPGLRSCDDGSPDRQPADHDHMGAPKDTPWGQETIDAAVCKSTAINFNGRHYDDIRGPAATCTEGQNCTVERHKNPFEFTVCAVPGRVTLLVCPREDVRACSNPYAKNESECGAYIPLYPREGDGCSLHTIVFPNLVPKPRPAPRPVGKMVPLKPSIADAAGAMVAVY